MSHTVESLVKAPGNLTRLSLALLLDQVVDKATLASLKEAAAAVGLDAGRGDTITVESLTFDRSYYEEEKAMAAAERKELYFTVAKLGGGLLAALVLIFVMWRTFRGLQARPTIPQELASPVAVGPAGEVPKVEIERISELQRQEQERHEKMQQQLQVLARNEPGTIANVVRLWLMEPAGKEPSEGETDVSSE